MHHTIYVLGNKQLEKLTCVACTEPFGEHSKRQLIRCLFRVQGTMASSPADADYFDITLDGEASSTVSYITSTSQVYYYNFSGVYHSVRFSWDNNPDNTGKIDKILYRQ